VPVVSLIRIQWSAEAGRMPARRSDRGIAPDQRRSAQRRTPLTFMVRSVSPRKALRSAWVAALSSAWGRSQVR